MPYANIDEAFTTYTESFTDSDGNSSLNSIRNPFNIKSTSVAEDLPAIANNYPTDNYNLDRQNEWDILDDDIRGLNKFNNQSLVQSPDRIFKNQSPDNLSVPIMNTDDLSNIIFNKKSDNIVSLGNCDNKTCSKLLDHISTCENCAKKLKKIIGLNNGNFMGIDIDLSKVIFWLVFIILIVAIYELLNSIMKKIRPF